MGPLSKPCSSSWSTKKTFAYCASADVWSQAQVHLQEKMREIKSGNYDKVLTDLRELVSIGSVRLGFPAGVYTSVTKIPGGRFVLGGPRGTPEARVLS